MGNDDLIIDERWDNGQTWNKHKEQFRDQTIGETNQNNLNTKQQTI